MRDDIHRRATLPVKVRKLLQMSLREADRLQPDLLNYKATEALRAEVARDVVETFVRRLRSQHDEPSFLGVATAGLGIGGALQSDIQACLDDGMSPTESVQEALARRADSYCREAKAALLADGAWGDGATYRAFSDALHAGAEQVATELIAAVERPKPKPRLSLDDNLLIGRPAPPPQ